MEQSWLSHVYPLRELECPTGMLGALKSTHIQMVTAGL
jgi:hypothetical protein